MSRLISLTFIVFLVLKLTNQIDWSWVWILSPLWITFITYLIGVPTLTYVIKKL